MTQTVIWATKHSFEKDWEYSWIQEIFSLFEYKIVNITDTTTLIKNAIIIFNHDINYIEYFRAYELNKIPFTAIHLSDEWSSDNMEFYNYTMCKNVFRNYYHPRYILPKVYFYPVGYKLDFWKNYTGPEPSTITSSERNYKWSFAGTSSKHRQHRDKKLALFESIQPNKLIWEYSDIWPQTQTGLNTEEYRQLMLDSKCIICVEGNCSVDSCRMCEALECGCIPVVVWSEYWEKFYNMLPPFIIGNSWQENAITLMKITDDELEQKRIDCIQFWNEYKTYLKNTLKNKCN
jgi:hypothetical protein